MGYLGVSLIDSAKIQQRAQKQTKPAEVREESVSFFDEAWSGHTIAKLTGDNFITDWLQNKDKVCTDGKDDGKIGFWEGAKSFAKGLIGGIPKMMINHPVATVITAGICAGATVMTGGAILPVLGAFGVASGVGMAGYGLYKSATAETDGEAKQALETMGMGVATTALSMRAADKMLIKAAEAGVKSAQVSDDANIFQKTWQMFKAIPESLTKSKEWTMSYLTGSPVNIELADGTKQVKVKGKLVEETLADGTNRKFENGVIQEETLADGTNRNFKNGIIQEETLPDGTYREYSTSTPGRVITEKLPDGTRIDRYEKYNYVEKRFTKTTLKDGTYKVIDENTGKIFEEKFADGTIEAYYSRYNGMKGDLTVRTANGEKAIIDNSTGKVLEGVVVEGNKKSFFKGGKLVKTREDLPDGGYKLYDADGNLTKHRTAAEIAEARARSEFVSRGGSYSESSSSRDRLYNGATPRTYDVNTSTLESTSVYDVEDCPSPTKRELLRAYGYNFRNFH